MGGGANIVFIRIGDTHTPAPPTTPTPDATTPPPAATAAAAADPTQQPTPQPPPPPQTATFKAAQPKTSSGNTVQFMRAVTPQDASAPAAPPAPAPAAPAVPAAGVPADPSQAAAAPSPGDAVAAIDPSRLPSGYPGDSAPKPALAAWMAAEAKKRGLPPELPVMASLVESGLHNDNFGDRDSVGYFQMRTGIWDEGPYKGFGQKPELQLMWFLDQAEQVRKQRIAAGQAASLNDPSQYGNWVADVERPAAEYRGRYQLRLGQARSLLRGEDV
jgi:hypothetical protein